MGACNETSAQNLISATKIRAASCDTQRLLDKWHAANGLARVIVKVLPRLRTIQKYLNIDEYVVDYSAGHVRGLPSSLEKAPASKKKQIILPEINLNVAHLGVDVEEDFEPIYVTMKKSRGRKKAKKGGKKMFSHHFGE